jgi:hypothetical protein
MKRILTVVICVLALIKCNNESGWVYSHLFTYPPESTAHDGNWEYLGDVSFKMPYESSGITEVRVEIEDKTDHIVLRDDFQIDYAFRDVDPCEEWSDFDILIIRFALGSAGSCDDSGTVHFLERTYVYDSSKVQFILH